MSYLTANTPAAFSALILLITSVHGETITKLEVVNSLFVVVCTGEVTGSQIPGVSAVSEEALTFLGI